MKKCGDQDELRHLGPLITAPCHQIDASVGLNPSDVPRRKTGDVWWLGQFPPLKNNSSL